MKDGRLPAPDPITQRDRSQVGFCLPRAYSPWPLGYSPLAFLSSFFYIWLCQVLLAEHGIFSCKLLVVACGIWFSDQGSNLVPLHWECRLLSHWTTREVPTFHSSWAQIILLSSLLFPSFRFLPPLLWDPFPSEIRRSPSCCGISDVDGEFCDKCYQ